LVSNDLRATIPINVLKFQQWLCWWAKKSTHLAYYLLNELELKEETLVPTTNFAKHVHSSMWVSIGNIGRKVKTNLYTATMDDMVRFVLLNIFIICFYLAVK
jgi:hypothetical protein